jgi:hypothetical protein
MVHQFLRSRNLLIRFGTQKNNHKRGRRILLYLFTKRVIKQTVVITEGYHCYQLRIKYFTVF